MDTTSTALRDNYKRPEVYNYLDGDIESEVDYKYGISTLISDKARVIKGGSWADRAWWLSPGSRRFLEEDKASRAVGFRCAMTRVGSPTGTRCSFGEPVQGEEKIREAQVQINFDRAVFR
jgi:sulfatase modifying factor 1